MSTRPQAGAAMFRLTGDITFDTVASLADYSAGWRGTDPANVDLSEIGATDSSAVALLLDWANESRGSGQVLRITGVPERLRDLVRVHGVAPLLDDVVVP